MESTLPDLDLIRHGRFGLFSSPLPNTQILVREEYAATPIADRIVWRASEERASSPFAHAMAD